MTYQISSRTGWRHKVDAPMPSNDAALAMLLGRDLPTARCGRTLQPVNFYQPGDTTSRPYFQCAPCFKEDR